MRIQLLGIDRAISNLGNLPRQVAIRHLRIALNAAGGTVRDAAKGLSPRETGLLKRSLTVKVKIPAASWDINHHHRPAYVVIGAKRGAVAPVIRKGRKFKALSIRKATKRVLGGGKVITRRATRYAHLAEKKHGFHATASKTAGPAATARAAEKLAKAFETEAAAMSKHIEELNTWHTS